MSTTTIDQSAIATNQRILREGYGEARGTGRM
jgi:hypothetical protein